MLTDVSDETFKKWIADVKEVDLKLNAYFSNSIMRLASKMTNNFIQLKIKEFHQLATDVNKKTNIVINDMNNKLQNTYNKFDATVKIIQDI